MTKLIKYTVAGDGIKQDKDWRNKFVCGIDKEYHILSVRNSSSRFISHLEIVVSDETALQMKIRNPSIEVTNYVKQRPDR